jgi:hypothetical protein
VKDCPTDWLPQTDVQMASGMPTAGSRIRQRPPIPNHRSRVRRHPRRPCARSNISPMRHAMPKKSPTASRAQECTTSRCTPQTTAVAETAQRHNLLGSAYKRRAVAEPTQDSQEALFRRPNTTGRHCSDCAKPDPIYPEP